MEPEVFTVKMSREEAAKYESAILFGYQEMDRLVGKFIELAGKDTTLVFCTAISQQPYLAYEEKGGRQVYRPSNFEAFVRFAGVSEPFKVAPVMAHQFHVYLESEQAAQRAETQLKALTVEWPSGHGGHPDRAADFLRLPYLRQPAANQQLVSSAKTGKSANFFDLFYKIEGLKSGMHHPGRHAVDSPSRSRALASRRQSAACRRRTDAARSAGHRTPSSMKERRSCSPGERREPALTHA